MGREDTFHFQDDRIRVPFRDMTTNEAEYHAETMWPYYDEKVSAIFEQKTKSLCLEFREEMILNQLNQIFGINLNDQREWENFKKVIRLFKFIIEIQQRFYALFYNLFVPWILAAITGMAIILIKQYFPEIKYYIEAIENISQ